MMLSNYTVEKITPKNEKEDKYGFRIIHNSKYCELYARCAETYDKWLEKLKLFCILTNYSSKYIKTHLIGRGSFAKVVVGVAFVGL